MNDIPVGWDGMGNKTSQQVSFEPFKMARKQTSQLEQNLWDKGQIS